MLLGQAIKKHTHPCPTAHPPPTHLHGILPALVWENFVHQLSLPCISSMGKANLTHRCLLLCLCKGLPKAATINHHRLWYGTGLAMSSGITAQDVIYTTMPLYHSAALMIGLHGCIVVGKVNFPTGISSWHTGICSKGKTKQATFHLPETVFTSTLTPKP